MCMCARGLKQHSHIRPLIDSFQYGDHLLLSTGNSTISITTTYYATSDNIMQNTYLLHPTLQKLFPFPFAKPLPCLLYIPFHPGLYPLFSIPSYQGLAANLSSPYNPIE